MVDILLLPVSDDSIEIEQGVIEVAELVKGAALKVHEQGEKLDVIELNVVNTNDEAKETVEELHEVNREMGEFVVQPF